MSSTGKTGQFTLYVGPMFAGKTTLMMESMKRCPQKYRIVLKYVKDCRYTQNPHEMFAHSGAFYSDMNITPTDDLETNDATIQKEELMCIGIDELQFMKHARLFINKWLSEGRYIYGAGLNSDFEGNIFPIMSELMPLATTIVTVPAFCNHCRTMPPNAYFTRRTVNVKDLECIGGSEMYEAICLACRNNIAKMTMEREYVLHADAAADDADAESDDCPPLEDIPEDERHAAHAEPPKWPECDISRVPPYAEPLSPTSLDRHWK